MKPTIKNRVASSYLAKTLVIATAISLSLVTLVPAQAQEITLDPVIYPLSLQDHLANATQSKALPHDHDHEALFANAEDGEHEAHEHEGHSHPTGGTTVTSAVIPTKNYSMVGALVPDGAMVEVRRITLNNDSPNVAASNTGISDFADASDWYELHADPSEGADLGSPELVNSNASRDKTAHKAASNPIWVEPGNAIQVRVTNGNLADVELSLIDPLREDASFLDEMMASFSQSWPESGTGFFSAAAPSPTPTEEPPAPMPSARKLEAESRAAMAVPGAPKIVLRSDWKANDSWVRSAPSYAPSVARVVIHHTESSSSYSQSQASAQIRGIFSYHRNNRGWNDIGYNFLVDKYGNIYEGRFGGITRNVVGAHAQGFNTGSVGISVLGSHNNNAVTTATRNSISSLIAWLSKSRGFELAGSSEVVAGAGPKFSSGTVVRLEHVIGHRDVGYTDCPGRLLYPLLAGFKQTAIAKHAKLTSVTKFPPRPIPYDDESLEQPVEQPEPEPTTIPGVTRIGVTSDVASGSADISRATFQPKSASVAVIARKDSFADAMAGGPLAGENGPILFTSSGQLDKAVSDELARVLKPQAKIYVLGGTAAISPDVANALKQYGTVERLSGPSRIATSVAIARKVLGEGRTSTVMIAREGPDDKNPWADSLAGGAWGATTGTPIVLSDRSLLSEDVLNLLLEHGITKVILLGGTGALEDSVTWSFPETIAVQRIQGKDRTETAVNVAKELWKTSASAQGAIVANGYQDQAWSYALAAAPLAAQRKMPLLLTNDLAFSPVANSFIQSKQYSDSFVLGPTSFVPARVATTIKK